ncbi:MAG: hydroxypyruvate isomerase [Moorella sp. (in: firmicutes)]
MPKFAANLTMLFTEVPFIERFKAAREAGFKAVEFLFPYEHGMEVVKKAVEENGLEVVLFNLPAGDWAAGERGIAADPRRKEEFREGVKQAVTWARHLRVPRLNCLAGKRNDAFTLEEQWRVLVENVRYAAEVLGEYGIKLMVEPLNYYDVPGFLLNTTSQVLRLIEEVGSANVFLQYDIYHAQKVEGNLTVILREHLAKIGHIQIADNPGRHQPGTGEINYSFLFRELDNVGYKGYVSLEYIPVPDTPKSLSWVKEYGYTLG